MNNEFVREYVILDILVDRTKDQIVLESLPPFRSLLSRL